MIPREPSNRRCCRDRSRSSSLLLRDLSLDQVRAVFGGKVANWRELGGIDLPVRIVDRESKSGTRETFEQQVLHANEPGENSEDCMTPKALSPRGEVIRCRGTSTAAVLDAVAKTPGAIGTASWLPRRRENG